jgi:catabolite repression protein CreC
VIARCQGHSSFVASVAFDHTQCDGRTYRFGSVGEDNKILLVSCCQRDSSLGHTDPNHQWDFSSGALHRPKTQASAFQNRASIASTISLALRRRGEPSTLNLPVDGAQATTTYHPAPSRNDVSVLQPIQATAIEGDLLTRIEFTTTAVIASTRSGLLRVWSRPNSHRHARDATITGP